MQSSNRSSRLTFLLLIVSFLIPSCTTPEVQQPDLYFLPLGEFSGTLIQELGDHYKQKFGLTVSVLPGLPLEGRTIDGDRRQVIAEELIETMRLKHQSLVTNSKAVIIGLTSADMYIRRYRWQFAFTFRKDGKYAVVSTARMDPVNLGEPPNDDRLRSRLRKMVTKNIGLLYFGLHQSNNPQSVLYNQIGGVEELDAAGENF